MTSKRNAITIVTRQVAPPLTRKSVSATNGTRAGYRSVDNLFRNERNDDRKEHKRDEN